MQSASNIILPQNTHPQNPSAVEIAIYLSREQLKRAVFCVTALISELKCRLVIYMHNCSPVTTIFLKIFIDPYKIAKKRENFQL